LIDGQNSVWNELAANADKTAQPIDKKLKEL
jgi:hypothetical protein